MLDLPLTVIGALALGAGLAVSNAAAAMRGLVTRGGVFDRTPKVPAGEPRPSGYRPRVGWTPLIELALGLALLGAALRAVLGGRWTEAPLIVVAGCGLVWVGTASAASSLRKGATR